MFSLTSNEQNNEVSLFIRLIKIKNNGDTHGC